MLYKIDPLQDPRWAQFLRQHPQASIFHTPGWLNALDRTYAYHLKVLTTSPPDHALTNGLVFCHIRSRLTGNRIVSLPFSDHCDLLAEDSENLGALIDGLREHAKKTVSKFLELRPISALPGDSGLQCFSKYFLHRLDLSPGIDEVFGNFHRNCIQRKIRRAERERLLIREGRTLELLRAFYDLTVRTRRRQGLPPQPFAWFENLADCLGDALSVWIATKDNQPIAAIITLAHKQVLVYKYGASDERFHNSGCMVYLLWTAIREAIIRGFTELDMGRSNIDDLGLIVFKQHWGAVPSELNYLRFPSRATTHIFRPLWSMRIAQKTCNHLPAFILTSIGSLVYRHIG
jgi:hypothetical protein